MGFDQSIKDMRTSGERFGVFLPNVKVKHFTGDASIAFRIMPAYAYGKNADGRMLPMGPTAWEPFRRPTGEFTEWGNSILLARGIGHGKDYKSGARKDILSPKTFDANAVDPLGMLYQAAAQYPEWQYLIEDQKTPDGKTVLQRAAITKATRLTLMNVVDVGDPQTSGIVQVGCFTKSSSDSLFATNGLAVAPSPAATPEMVAHNYLLQWAYGDITDPNTGPVLLCIKGKAQGQFSKYNITVMIDSQNQVRRWPLGEAFLQQRYDLFNLDTIVAKETEQEIIGTLCQLLNMRSPHGRHEWNLLREVFGQIAKIPNPPENAPAAVPTVQSGFVAPQPMAQAPAQSPFGPGQAITMPQGGFGPGQAIQMPQGTFGPGQATPSVSTPPVQQGNPGVQYGVPVQQVPPAAPAAPAPGLPSVAAVGPAVVAAQQQWAPQTLAPAPAAANAPVVPGDNVQQQVVPGTTQSRAEFLASLKKP